MDIQTIAEKAADWWVDAISSGRRGSSGDGMVDMLRVLATGGGLGLMGDIARFREALVLAVITTLGRCDDMLLSTDYGPEGQLADAARKVGLRANFPMKTMMSVDRNGVTVSCGYRAPTVRVCGDAIWTARLYAHDYSDIFDAYRGTVESEARSMYGAALDALAAVGRGAVTLERDGYAVEERRV